MNYRQRFFNNNPDQTSKILKYNIPVFIENNPLAQCAFDYSVEKVLEAFQESLNNDGCEAISSIFETGNHGKYIELLVEGAMSEVFHGLEDVLYDDMGYIETDDASLSVDTVIGYLTENIIQLQTRMNSFAFVIMTTVVSNLIVNIRNLRTCGVIITTFAICQDRFDRGCAKVT